ncbi:MAG: glycosyltransferase family 87 protein [Acidimicrobiia bacterium]
MRPARLTVPLVTTVLLFVAVIVWLSIRSYNTHEQIGNEDATADWLVASAFADGIDPHIELFELASIYEVDFWPSETEESRISRHPRTPGSLILLYPLSWVDADDALLTMLITGLVCSGAGLLFLCRLRVISYSSLFLGLVYVTLLGPGRWSQIFGTHLAVILLCVAVAFTLLWRRDSIGSGVWLAVAATLRLFPAVLLIALLMRRKSKAAVAMITTTILLNLVPLLFSHVSLASTLQALTSTTGRWFDLESNISLSRGLAHWLPMSTSVVVALIVLLLVGGWFILHSASLPASGEWTVLLSLAVMALPLSWPQYLLAVVPVFMVFAEEVRFESVVGAALTVASIVLTISVSRTQIYIVGLTLLVAVLGGIAATDKSRSSKVVVAPMTGGD